MLTETILRRIRESFQVGDRLSEGFRIIPGVAKQIVTRVAEESPNAPGRVAVVDYKDVALGFDWWRTPTDGTQATLLNLKRVPVLDRHAVEALELGLPVCDAPLPDVFGMAVIVAPRSLAVVLTLTWRAVAGRVPIWPNHEVRPWKFLLAPWAVLSWRTPSPARFMGSSDLCVVLGRPGRFSSSHPQILPMRLGVREILSVRSTSQFHLTSQPVKAAS